MAGSVTTDVCNTSACNTSVGHGDVGLVLDPARGQALGQLRDPALTSTSYTVVHK